MVQCIYWVFVALFYVQHSIVMIMRNDSFLCYTFGQTEHKVFYNIKDWAILQKEEDIGMFT